MRYYIYYETPARRWRESGAELDSSREAYRSASPVPGRRRPRRERDPPRGHRRATSFPGWPAVVISPPRHAAEDGLLFAARVRERLELHRDLVLVLETVGTLHQIGDVLLEEIFRARTDETSRRLVCHAAHADADLHAAGYVARRVHQRAQRTRQRTLQGTLGRSARARTRQAEIQRGVAVVAGAIAAPEAAARVAVVIVVVMLAGLHRRLQIRR